MLKVSWQHTEALHEAEGLAALSGEGAVEVYRFEQLEPARPGAGPDGDGGTTAMLLERCRPGTELRGRPEAEQHVVVTDLLRSVWAVELPPDHPFRPLSAMADDWVAAAEACLAADPGQLDAGVAREGLALFRELSRPGPADVLLFTDLHAGNVLSGERRPWLLIDPEAVRRRPSLRRRAAPAELRGVTGGRPDRPADRGRRPGRLDPRRVRQWLFGGASGEPGRRRAVAGARRRSAPAGWSGLELCRTRNHPTPGTTRSQNSSSWRASSTTGHTSTCCTPASRKACSFSANARRDRPAGALGARLPAGGSPARAVAHDPLGLLPIVGDVEPHRRQRWGTRPRHASSSARRPCSFAHASANAAGVVVGRRQPAVAEAGGAPEPGVGAPAAQPDRNARRSSRPGCSSMPAVE